MKKQFAFIFCLLITPYLFSQTFVFKLENTDEATEYPIEDGKVKIASENEELKSVYLVLKTPMPNTEAYKISVDGRPTIYDLPIGVNVKEIKDPDGINLKGLGLSITKSNGDEFKVQLLEKEAEILDDDIDDDDDDDDDDDEEENTNTSFKTPEEIIQELFPDVIHRQRVGLMIPSGNSNTRFVGEKYVHIFLDGYGNPIIRAIPQGSPEKTYVVHIVTSIPDTDFSSIRYNVKQTSGGIDDLLVFRNSGELDNFTFNSQVNYISYHYEIALTESNKNIVFEVNRGVSDGTNLNNTKLSTHTIPIKIYNGSFDIGLISSELESPSYSFVADANDNTMGKVKKANEGNRGIVTTMATFYASPVILLEKFIFKPKVNGETVDIPNYKLTGRNFVEDHKIYERIYPTVGLSVNEQTLENIFYGFNFEAVRGASLFVGWHHGRVNTFGSPSDDFSFNDTVISKEDFDLNTKKEWQTDFAIGVNLDILVILNLLQQGGSATKP